MGEYYNPNQYSLLRTNSCRTAIWVALKKLKPKQVYVPHYMCDVVYEAINSLSIPMIKYYIDEQFFPVNINPSKNDCLILVNYFGCFDTQMTELMQLYANTNVILDYSLAFFCPPSKNAYTVYSPRKFIGVPDGGYFIDTTQNETELVELERDFSYDRMMQLLMPIESTTNSSYEYFKKNEARLISNYKGMSRLTEYLLRGVDYTKIINKRKENYKFIHSQFAGINQLCLPEEAVPYIYPLLTSKNLVDIKKEFISDGFYASTLWVNHLESEYENTFEQTMAMKGLFIPIDQRYNEESLDRLCKLICSKI